MSEIKTHLDIPPSMLHDVDTRLNGHLCARRVYDEIDTLAATLLQAELLLHLCRVTSRVRETGLTLLELWWEVRVRRRVRLGELEPRGHDVDRDDTRGTDRPCDSHAQEADGPRAEDDDGLGGLEAGDVRDGVDRDGERFDLEVGRSSVVVSVCGEVGRDACRD